jgi:serine/threonine protein kinase
VILSNLYNNKADMWALGCIIYELCTGEKAFLGDWAVLNYATAEHSTSLTLFPSEWTSDCTVGAFFRTLNSWTGNLLRRVPNERPSADRLVTIWGDLKPLLNPSDNSEEWFSLAIKAKEGVSTTKSRTGLFPFPPAFVSMEEIRHGLDTAVALQQKTEGTFISSSYMC